MRLLDRIMRSARAPSWVRLAIAAMACLEIVGAAPGAAAVAATPARCVDLFRRETPLISTGSPSISGLVVADFNGDHRDDIAYGSAFSAGQGQTILLSRGDGRFDRRVARTSSPVWLSIAGDVDGDGRQDIIATDLNGGPIVVLRGDGAGGFVERAGPVLPSGAVARSIASFDEDGHADVLVQITGLASRSLQVLRGDGAGGFAAVRPALEVPGLGGGLAVGDFNGDGRRDVVLDETPAGRISVAPGDGAGGFGPLTPAMVWNFASDRFAVADFDRDGRLDLGIRPIGGTMALAGDGSGRFTPFRASRGIPVAGFNGAMSADFDGDGNPDLAATSGSSDGEIYVWLGDGHGRFRAAGGTPEWGGRYPAASAETGDFNGDGRPDLVGASGWQQALRVHLNTGGRVIRGSGQAIRWIQASPRTIVRGGIVKLAARLRCPPRKIGLYRRPLSRSQRTRWTRLATLATDYRGIAVYADSPRFSVEYQWRAVGAARRTVKPTRPKRFIVRR
jgi:hypothetical protein